MSLEEILTSTPPNNKFVISASGIGERFKEYYIMTTDSKIKTLISDIESSSKEENKHIYRSVYLSITQYSTDKLQEAYVLKNDSWQNWCDDVVIFYVTRLILFNKHIPINDLFCVFCYKSTNEQKVKKCGRCKLDRYCSTDCQLAHWGKHKLICKEC